MKKYQIAVDGCDDSTIIQEELTEQELLLLRRIAKKVNATSEYACMPTIKIKESKE